MIDGDAPRRRSTDRGEPSNREILDHLETFALLNQRDHDAIESRMERMMVDHATLLQSTQEHAGVVHADLAERLGASTTDRALIHAQLAGLVRVSDEIANLHDFRVQVTTIGASIKWVVGGSLIAAVTGIISIAMTLTHAVAP